LDDLNSVGELYSKDDFRQLVMAIETPPAFFGALSEFEDHRERGLVRETLIAIRLRAFLWSRHAPRRRKAENVVLDILEGAPLLRIRFRAA
jgi:hypothetical protein